MKNFIILASAVLTSLILLTGSTAHAYIPPSHYIVKNWVTKHNGLRAFKLRTVVTAYASDKPTPVHFKVTTAYNSGTQKFKSWAMDDFDKVLYSTERDLNSMSPLSKLLFLSNTGEVLSALESSGVPLRTEAELMKLRTELDRRASEQESLVRWNGSIAWVLGIADSKQEPESPQLWFEKDLFIPVRFLYRVANVGDLYDLQLENYKFTREFPYPRNISLYQKGVGKILADQFVDLTLNGDSITNQKVVGSGLSELGMASSKELRNLIQTYYDVVR